MEDLVQSLGYFGAFLGALLEGEILFLAVVQTVKMGYLHWYPAMAAIFLGAITADWFFFAVGRRRGQVYLQRSPRLYKKVKKISALFERFPIPLLLTYRFIYGFRTVLPLLFGISSVPVPTFLLLSLLSTVAWVVTIGWLGYHLTEWMAGQIQFLKTYGVWIVASLLLSLAAYLFRNRAKAAANGTGE